MAPPVREQLRVVQILDVRQLLVDGRITHPHRGGGVKRSYREVLGHAFGEPQRILQDVRQAELHLAGVVTGDVELERVDQFVTEHMIGVRQRPGHRQDDPAFEGFGETAGALPNGAFHGVGLAEVGGGRIQHQGLTPPQLVCKKPGQPGIPAFRHPRHNTRGLGLLRVVIDVEVFGGQHPEIKGPELHLVAPEILRPGRDGKGTQEEQAHGNTAVICGGTMSAEVPARTVHCVKLHRDLPALLTPPWPGPLGQRIFEQVSQEAWTMWEEQMKMILNEYRLLPFQKEAQQLVAKHMEEYFFGKGTALPPGFVPESTPE